MSLHPQYFVDRDAEIDLFFELHNQEQVAKPIVKIVGLSGIGKSALLQKYHAICEENNAPVVFIYGGKNRSVVSFLAEMSEQLQECCGASAFREFKGILRQIHQIQDKLLTSKKESISKKLFGPLKLLGRGITTAASTAAGTDVLLAAAAEVIGEALISGVAGRLDDLVGVGLSAKQIALLNNVAEEALKAFTADFVRLQEQFRITILIDGIDTIQHLESWLAQELIPAINDHNTIFVVSNRVSFDQCWNGLLAESNLVELRPFSFKETQEFLSQRSSTVSRSTAQTVHQLTDGLPLSLALWSEFVGTTPHPTKATFTHDRALFVAEQIEHHLLSQFADDRLKDIVHVCASLRHFDEALLAHVLDMPLEEAQNTYKQLTHYVSIFNVHPSGQAVHALLRHYLVDNFRRHNELRYWAVLQAALVYYEQRFQEAHWAVKGEHAIDCVYYASHLEGQTDLIKLFFNEYGSAPVTVMAARQSDLTQILEVDWKAFPHEENRISMERLTQWFNSTPESFRVAKDIHGHVLGYSCILKLAPEIAQAILDGTLSFKQINTNHLRKSTPAETPVMDYMLDSLAVADLKRSEVGAALLRDMLAQMRGNVGRLLSVAVTHYGSSLLQRTGFRLVRTLPEMIDGFSYEVYELDLHDELQHSPLLDVLRKYAAPHAESVGVDEHRKMRAKTTPHAV